VDADQHVPFDHGVGHVTLQCHVTTTTVYLP
jgi:hypothetical protein